MALLSIIIPAYNEEEAISSIIERTLAARDRIISEGGIDDVELIVVNDGSLDHTAEIARSYASRNLIKFISYEKNRGYGAAIKAGFAEAAGDYVGFLDADGTCDPLLFIDFLRKMKEAEADVIIGGRLHSQSEMPFTRKVGNVFYRELVTAISSSRVSDVASGMRLLKKSALRRLYPLPDGMHFTPAMSVRAVLDRSIKIEEVPIPYKERIGKSKLSVLKDGVRFLGTILEIAFTYKPLRLFGTVGILFLMVALLYAIDPVIHYLQFRNVPEDRIYRLIFIIVASVSGLQLISVGLIGQAMTNLVHGYEMETRIEKILDRAFLNKLAYFGVLCLIGALALNYKPISQYLSTRTIQAHWSYVVTGGLLVLMGFQLLAFSVINRILTLLKDHDKSLIENEKLPR